MTIYMRLGLIDRNKPLTTGNCRYADDHPYDIKQKTKEPLDESEE